VKEMNKEVLFKKLVSFTSSVHRVQHELTKDAKPDFISQLQYHILEFIAVNQPVTPSEINDCLNMSMPNTSRELSKLQEKYLIEKLTDSNDRRKQYVRLSPEGEATMNKAFATIQSHFLERIRNATNEDLKEMEQAFDILQTKLFYQ
jgi:MarR family transcriptional regulator, teicoplanin-associated locus regulator